MFITEPAEFLYLHSVRMRLFVFGGVVVALFAFRTRQSYLSSHNRTSLFRHKKKTFVVIHLFNKMLSHRTKYVNHPPDVFTAVVSTAKSHCAHAMANSTQTQRRHIIAPGG
jgi:hypothetical protein